ncbi:MAG: hypothetical protein AB2745_08670 [Candidatus Thiodiazotropha endolucinida]
MLKHTSTYFPPYLTREQAIHRSIQKQSTEEWVDDYEKQEAECIPEDEPVESERAVNE